MAIATVQLNKVQTVPTGLSKLDYVTFDTLLEKLNPFQQENPVFDLRGIALITPSGFVRLAASCCALAQQNKRPRIILTDGQVISYAVRTGFIKTISSVADIIPPLPKLHNIFYEYFNGKNPHLIELTRIQSADDIPAILEKIRAVLNKEFNYPGTESLAIISVISEVCQNTFHHNSSTYGFIAMQVYKQKQGMLVEIAISDYGDGLRTTLTRNPSYQNIKSDTKAIQEAIKKGVSEHSVPLRGFGLYHLHKVTEQHGHSLNIRSGNSKVHYKMTPKGEFQFSVPHLPGVHITLCFRAK